MQEPLQNASKSATFKGFLVEDCDHVLGCMYDSLRTNGYQLSGGNSNENKKVYAIFLKRTN
jgi:hypothetical protein